MSATGRARQADPNRATGLALWAITVVVLLAASALAGQPADRSVRPFASTTPTAPELARFGASTAEARDQADRFPLWGLSQGFQPLDLSDRRLDDVLDGVRATGATVIRLDLPWARIQPNGPGSFDWTDTLRVYDAARTHGLRVLPVTSGMPGWAGTTTPDSPDYYFEFLRQAGRVLIPRGIRTIEIVNEPNVTGMDPIGYTRSILIPGASGFRSAGATLGRTVTIVSGGLAPAATDGTRWSQLDFLTGIYAAGGRGYFDAVGTHPYTWPDDPTRSAPNNWLLRTAQLRATMVAHDDADKKIWATEFGFPTSTGDRGIDETRQADYLVSGAERWRSYPWSGPLIVYSLQDLRGSSADPEDAFGLLRADGSRKAAFDAVRRAIRNDAESPVPDRG